MNSLLLSIALLQGLSFGLLFYVHKLSQKYPVRITTFKYVPLGAVFITILSIVHSLWLLRILLAAKFRSHQLVVSSHLLSIWFGILLLLLLLGSVKLLFTHHQTYTRLFTEQTAAQNTLLAQYQSVVEALNLPVVLVERRGTLGFANRAARKLLHLELESQQQIVIQTMFPDFILPPNHTMQPGQIMTVTSHPTSSPRLWQVLALPTNSSLQFFALISSDLNNQQSGTSHSDETLTVILEFLVIVRRANSVVDLVQQADDYVAHLFHCHVVGFFGPSANTLSLMAAPSLNQQLGRDSDEHVANLLRQLCLFYLKDSTEGILNEELVPGPIKELMNSLNLSEVMIHRVVLEKVTTGLVVMLVQPPHTLTTQNQQLLAVINTMLGFRLLELVLGQASLELQHNLKTYESMLQNALADYDNVQRLLETTKNSLRFRVKELEHFVFGLSHDLRTPVISAGGILALLMEEYSSELPQEVVDYLTRVSTNIGYMSALLRDFMEYLRISTVREVAQKVSSRELIQRILDDYTEVIEQKAITLTMQGEFPIIVCERNRLFLVFKQLISNAIYHMGRVANPTILIATEDQPESHYFKVTDNGVGIPPEHQDRVFKVFERLTPNQATQGTGMGLAMVKKVIECHGGTIGVESQPGAGTSFWFTIPKTFSIADNFMLLDT